MFGVEEWKVTRSSPTIVALSLSLCGCVPTLKITFFMEPRCRKFVPAIKSFF